MSIVGGGVEERIDPARQQTAASTDVGCRCRCQRRAKTPPHPATAASPANAHPSQSSIVLTTRTAPRSSVHNVKSGRVEVASPTGAAVRRRSGGRGRSETFSPGPINGSAFIEHLRHLWFHCAREHAVNESLGRRTPSTGPPAPAPVRYADGDARRTSAAIPRQQHRRRGQPCARTRRWHVDHRHRPGAVEPQIVRRLARRPGTARSRSPAQRQNHPPR